MSASGRLVFAHVMVRNQNSSGLPNVLLIGAQRSGTTSLATELEMSGLVALGAEKEPGDLTRFEEGPQWRERYRKKFAECDNRLILDASTVYSMRTRRADTAHVAHTVLGAETKILYLMRDPFARMLSHHRHLVGAGLADPDFDVAFGNHAELLLNSLYYFQLESWISAFGGERVMLLTMDDLISSRLDTLTRVARFLEATPGEYEFVSSAVNRNAASEAAIDRRTIAGRVATSRLYRDRIRPAVPESLRSRARDRMSRQSAPEQLRGPTDALARALRAAMRDDVASLRADFAFECATWSFESRQE